MSKKDVYRFWALLDTAEEGISVRFPDLPGCLTAADTAEEAHAAAREALEGFLYVMKQDGDAIPDPSEPDGNRPKLTPQFWGLSRGNPLRAGPAGLALI